MNKNKFLFIGLLSVTLVFGIVLASCNGNEEVWETVETLPELTGLKIKNGNIDIKVENLGIPDKDPAKAEAGSVTLFVKSQSEPFTVSSPEITASTMSEAIVAEFGSTFTSTPPGSGSYSGTKPAQLANGDFLWIRVTEENISVYYVIKITVEYNPVDDFSIKYHPASRSLSLTDWNAAAPADKALSVVMTQEYKVGDVDGYKYQWYSNTAFSNTDGAAIPAATASSYTPTITAAKDYFYYVVVTLSVGEKLIGTETSNAARIQIAGDAITPAATQFTIGGTRLNYVRGVGGTGSFMFRTGTNADASPDADVKYIDLLFGELGANILRIMVQDDYKNYITNSIQSRNSATFYHNARDNFFPVIRKANEYGGYVFANPWTAPARMKSGNSLAGGSLKTDSTTAREYAEHLQEFLKWLNTNNAPIFALGILNEPDYGGGASYEGMGMTGQETRDWFRAVGNFPTSNGIIPGYGGGGPTHHVLAMSGDSAGQVATYMNPQINDTGANGANNKIELIGRHYYSGTARYTNVVGNSSTAWNSRPQLSYTGPYEADSLAASPQMYAPGSTAGSIKREVWQTEHDLNFGNSTVPPNSNPQNAWNSAFGALQDIDYALRVVGESVFCWWYSSSFSGFVTSYQASGFAPYTITPRGRAFAHYARYVNETWLLSIERTRGSITFNNTNFNAGSTVPKISAFEDVNGKFISIVMFTPNRSTNNGDIASSFGAGGSTPIDDPRDQSVNVGRIEVVLPEGFTASSASAIRSYGHANATGETWDDVPRGTPRYWIDEPVFLSADGTSVEVTLKGGNIISIMVRGEWADSSRGFASPERVRPYTVK
jgi:hypothetical protein